MPRFRFETTEFDRTTTSDEELESADRASLRAIEKAREVLMSAEAEGFNHSRSFTKVYDEAGYLVATVNHSDVMAETAGHSPDSPVTEEPGVKRSG